MTIRSSVPTADVESLFLKGLAPHERQAVIAKATRRRVLTNTVMSRQGGPSDRAFMLVKGRARFFFITPDGRKIILHWLVPGDIFGWALLAGRPSYLVSAEMVHDGLVLTWDRIAVRELSAQYPMLLHNALSIASDYLAWYVSAHLALTCHTARERVANVLTNVAQTIGRKVPAGVELDVTNEELASAANVTLFTVSRLLSGWQRRGVVVKSRGRVVLRSTMQLLSSED